MFKCPKHPGYTGNKKPSNICSKCMQIYVTKKVKPRLDTKRPQVFEDKKKKQLDKTPNLKRDYGNT